MSLLHEVLPGGFTDLQDTVSFYLTAWEKMAELLRELGHTELYSIPEDAKMSLKQIQDLVTSQSIERTRKLLCEQSERLDSTVRRFSDEFQKAIEVKAGKWNENFSFLTKMLLTGIVYSEDTSMAVMSEWCAKICHDKEHDFVGFGFFTWEGKPLKLMFETPLARLTERDGEL